MGAGGLEYLAGGCESLLVSLRGGRSLTRKDILFANPIFIILVTSKKKTTRQIHFIGNSRSHSWRHLTIIRPQ
jgi:hypothetical protein